MTAPGTLASVLAEPAWASRFTVRRDRAARGACESCGAAIEPGRAWSVDWDAGEEAVGLACSHDCAVAVAELADAELALDPPPADWGCGE